MSATLLEFARANDSAAGTTKRLQKQSILADYFRSPSEVDLRLAVRFASGRPFAATDERVLNVGWSIISDVLLSMLKLDPRQYHDLVVKSGEIGEALAKVWTSHGVELTDARMCRAHDGLLPPGDLQHGSQTRATEETLTLQEIASAFDELAGTGVVARKRTILVELFARCTEPREAAYLAKIIFREMRSGAREGVLQGAIAEAFDKSLVAIQRCQLLVGDLDEVAVLAKRDALETAAFRLFHPIQFMLATPQETAQLAAEAIGGRTFFAEDKLDGVRAQIHKSGDRVAIYTRTMDRADESFPDVVAEIAKLPGDFLLDGEIVPYADGHVLPFAHIQRRLGRKRLSARLLKENPARFIAFDIVFRNAELLMGCSLIERRAALDDLASHGDLLTTRSTAVTTTERIAQAFEDARARRNEGIVMKDPQSSYSPGRRGQWWLKLKTHLPTFDCVVTMAEYGHGKRRGVLSDYTFAVWDREPDLPGATLVNIGKAYSGITDEEIGQLTERFLKLARERFGHSYVVEPRIVLEIACDQIQRSARHASGYALRFPRIKRIRWDKRAQDADRLGRVIEIYESGSNFGRTVTDPTVSAPEPMLWDQGT